RRQVPCKSTSYHTTRTRPSRSLGGCPSVLRPSQGRVGARLVPLLPLSHRLAHGRTLKIAEASRLPLLRGLRWREEGTEFLGDELSSDPSRLVHLLRQRKDAGAEGFEFSLRRIPILSRPTVVRHSRDSLGKTRACRGSKLSS